MPEKPKIIIDLSGGLVQQIMATQEVEVIVVDYDDLEGDGPIVEIDGTSPAYVINTPAVDLFPDRVNELYQQISEQEVS